MQHERVVAAWFAGKLDGVPGVSSYPSSFRQQDYALAEPPRVDGYRGFVFINFDPQSPSLNAYLDADG